jgi:hypothetical protein
MTQKIYSPLTHTQTADALLKTLVNPHHRAIIANYRRHALLEVAGRWPEILVPEMTVDHPVYRISVDGKTTVLDGREAVAGFYLSLTVNRANVFGPVSQILAVADWGFAAEATFQQHLTGDKLIARGVSADANKIYRSEWRVASIWHYTMDAKLIGEHIYEENGSRTFVECDPSEVVSPEQAMKMLEPVLAIA